MSLPTNHPAPELQMPIPCGKKNQPLIGPMLRRTDNLIFRRLNEICRASGVEDITAMHGWILKYLEDHSDEEIYQKDIEKNFSITRSTTTNILQLMESKGYIRRESVPHDARLKKLVLTEPGAAANERIRQCLQETDRQINACLEEQERLELLRILEKLQTSISNSNVQK